MKMILEDFDPRVGGPTYERGDVRLEFGHSQTHAIEFLESVVCQIYHLVRYLLVGVSNLSI